MIRLTFIFTISFCIYNNCDLSADAQEEDNKSNAKSLGTNNTSDAITPVELFSKVENSVAQVTASVNVTDPYGSSLGSGFVYDKNGHIITNYHVLAASANAEDIIVTFQDESVFNVKLIASNPFSDISVLRIQNISEAKLLPLKIGEQE